MYLILKNRVSQYGRHATMKEKNVSQRNKFAEEYLRIVEARNVSQCSSDCVLITNIIALTSNLTNVFSLQLNSTYIKIKIKHSVGSKSFHIPMLD